MRAGNTFGCSAEVLRVIVLGARPALEIKSPPGRTPDGQPLLGRLAPAQPSAHDDLARAPLPPRRGGARVPERWHGSCTAGGTHEQTLEEGGPHAVSEQLLHRTASRGPTIWRRRPRAAGRVRALLAVRVLVGLRRSPTESDAKLAAAVTRWLAAQGLPASGRLGAATWTRTQALARRWRRGGSRRGSGRSNTAGRRWA
jgi:hypothetical protein